MTFDLGPFSIAHTVNVSQHDKYLFQRPFIKKLSEHKHQQTHTNWTDCSTGTTKLVGNESNTIPEDYYTAESNTQLHLSHNFQLVSVSTCNSRTLMWGGGDNKMLLFHTNCCGNQCYNSMCPKLSVD